MAAHEAAGSADILADVRNELTRTWAHVLPSPGARVALLDFPDYGNVGDSGIWLGERRTLSHLGIDVAYSCSIATYDPRHVARAVGHSGTILLHGGGNFGDLWPRHQQFRESVAREFPEASIVQLPQSLHFADDANLSRASAIFAKHPDFRLLVRDQLGLPIAERVSGNRATLCPDAALSLRLRRSRATLDVLFLLRADRERVDRGPPPHQLLRDLRWESADWDEDPFRPSSKDPRWRAAIKTRARGGRRRILTSLSASPVSARLATSHRDAMAQRRLDGGIRLISRGRVVVTDRLHGHILCLVVGIPHVFLDNTYGKVTAFADTWGLAGQRSRMATTMEEAIAAARDLLDGGM